jgi:hypothetical protein
MRWDDAFVIAMPMRPAQEDDWRFSELGVIDRRLRIPWEQKCFLEGKLAFECASVGLSSSSEASWRLLATGDGFLDFLSWTVYIFYSKHREHFIGDISLVRLLARIGAASQIKTSRLGRRTKWASCDLSILCGASLRANRQCGVQSLSMIHSLSSTSATGNEGDPARHPVAALGRAGRRGTVDFVHHEKVESNNHFPWPSHIYA